MFKLLRMNNYYFIVGGSAAWAEIVRILQEKKIPFAWMKSDTEGAVSVPYEKIDEVIAAGFVPVVIGAECGRASRSSFKAFWSVKYVVYSRSRKKLESCALVSGKLTWCSI